MILASELIDMVIMTAALGFIFMDVFKRPAAANVDPLEYYQNMKAGFDWMAFRFAVMVSAPAVILHEFGHKMVGMLLGFTTVFHASYMGLGIGIVLKLLNTGFLFFVPGYVQIIGSGTPVEFALTALAGPALNFVLWIGAKMLLKEGNLRKQYVPLAIMTQKINGFLLVFNLLPIPGFDGFHVYSQLFRMF